MGMGEPLANYGPTVATLRRLRDDVGLSARHLTVSTVGMVPAIRGWQVKSCRSAWRSRSTPPPMRCATSWCRSTAATTSKSLVDAAIDWREQTGRRVSFEWALIDGVNDTPEQLDALIDTCADQCPSPRQFHPAQPNARAGRPRARPRPGFVSRASAWPGRASPSPCATPVATTSTPPAASWPRAAASNRPRPSPPPTRR
jgi:hypothetical protein